MTTAQERARDVVNAFDGTLPRDQADYLKQLIAAALTATRREALTEAAQVARATNCAAINPSWSAAQEAIAVAIEKLRDTP